MQHVGVRLSPITVPYPEDLFEYVSAGGNSSRRARITLNTPTIGALIGTLAQKIRYRRVPPGNVPS